MKKNIKTNLKHFRYSNGYKIYEEVGPNMLTAWSTDDDWIEYVDPETEVLYVCLIENDQYRNFWQVTQL